MKIKTDFLSNIRNVNFIMGALIGIPIAYPSPPFYLFSFLVYFFYLIKSEGLIDKNLFYLIFGLIFFSLLSNLLSQYKDIIDPFRAMYTSLFFVLFLFGLMVHEKYKFLNGLVFSINVWSLFVLIFFLFVAKPYQNGLLMFSVPDYRLWGVAYFPDWPNYLAFLLSLGFMINILVFKNYGFALINFFAALSTTSRTALIALIIILIYVMLKNRKLLIVFLLILIPILISIIYFKGSDEPQIDEFFQRLLVFEDRAYLYLFAIDIFSNNIFLGVGSILFDSRIGVDDKYASFHNSYLDVLVRYGLVGFFLFLMLFSPILNCKKNFSILAIISFFLIGALFQNFLKHPHLIMILTVLLTMCSQGKNYDK